jgi:hypothetical protein
VRDASERLAYQRELIAAAKRLGLPVRGDIERSLIRHATETIRTWIAAHGRPKNLSDLLDKVATSFSIEIVEINTDADIAALLKRIPPTRRCWPGWQPNSAMHRRIILRRQNRATGDATGRHQLPRLHRSAFQRGTRYSSSLDGKQLRFAFRKRAAEQTPRGSPGGQDAGNGVHPDLFGPVFQAHLESAGRLTFDVVERVRAAIAPDASRESAIYACVRHCSEPVFLLKARMLYKNSEKRQLNDLLSGLDDVNPPQPKLRVLSSAANDAAAQLGIRFHENMQVPETSLVSQAFNAAEDRIEGREPLEIWQTSSGGPIGHGGLYIEARRRGDEVWSLVHVNSAATSSRTLNAMSRGLRERPANEDQIVSNPEVSIVLTRNDSTTASDRTHAEVGQGLPVSDVGLAKTCRRYAIPSLHADSVPECSRDRKCIGHFG